MGILIGWDFEVNKKPPISAHIHAGEAIRTHKSGPNSNPPRTHCVCCKPRSGVHSLLLNSEFVAEGGVSQGEIIAADDFGYVDIGNPDALNFADNDFTIAAWMKVPEALGQRGNVFSNGGDNAGGVRYVLAYLENGGTVEKAQTIAAHESPRTTKLYDRTGDEITLDEVERIVI